MNERSFKNGLKHPDDRMVNEAVADECLVNNAPFGIVDGKAHVWSMPVRAGRKVVTQTHAVILEMAFKCLHVPYCSFAAAELLPRAKEIFH